MTVGWTVEIGNAGGALTTYEGALPTNWVKRLNGIGYFALHITDISGASVPTRDQVVRVTWRKGESDERHHFSGFVTDVREDGRRKAFWVRGLSLEGFMAQSTIGALRSYVALTPYAILQQAGAPNGLIYNSQGNLKPLAATSLQYGSSASVPYKVDGANPGTSMSFLADSARNATNIQRLILQARYDGASYGLEWFCQLEGGSNSDPRLYVVKRRNRAAAYTAETWTVDDDLVNTRRGTEGLTAAQAIRVVGLGDGTTRVESGLVGSGGLEGIVADKSILNATNALNMANRLSELLNPATEMVTGWKFDYNFATEVGDDVILAQTGRANVTLRCFEIGYDLNKRGFFIVLGRPRTMPDDPLAALDKMAGGQAHAPQLTDTIPITILDSGLVGHYYSGVASGTSVVVAGASGTTIFSATTSIPSDFGSAEAYWIEVTLDVDSATDLSVDSHAHDMGSHVHGMNHYHAYDKTTSITVGSANSGNAGADPHGHTATPNHTSTGSTVSFDADSPFPAMPNTDGPSTNTTGAATPGTLINGPFRLDLKFRGAISQEIFLARWVLPHLRTNKTLVMSASYPFAVRVDGSYTPTEIIMSLANHGETDVTIGTGTGVLIMKKSLHRHNAV